MDSQAIAKWAEQQTQSDSKPAKRKPGQRGPELTGAEVGDILRWHAEGLTQVQIATRFDPPKSQSCISDTLAKYGTDRLADSKAILRGGAADMALNIIKHGKPKDQVQALKGLGVLEEKQNGGITVHVGRGGMVNLGTLVSPPAVQALGEGEQNR